ncbi:hypothetical protein [Dentiradicibacter hellwigii]|uniref:Uncharacterized protein n=1 Tax=Dentiradicibacter hellwigii TaxID=3149053 RepID=A0ABV4UJM8_9RHOO
MQERPILFSAPMVRAILGGHKTQTRRPVKPMKHPYGEWLSVEEVVGEIKAGTGAVNCPLGRKGDRLWVREAFHSYHWDVPRVVYRADGEHRRVRTQFMTYEVGALDAINPHAALG